MVDFFLTLHAAAKRLSNFRVKISLRNVYTFGIDYFNERG